MAEQGFKIDRLSLSKYVYRRNKKNSVFNESDGLFYCFVIIIDNNLC